MDTSGPEFQLYQPSHGSGQVQHAQSQKNQPTFQLQHAPRKGAQLQQPRQLTPNNQQGGFSAMGAAATRVQHGPSSGGQQGLPYNNQQGPSHNSHPRNNQPHINQQGANFQGNQPLHRAQDDIESSAQQSPSRLGRHTLYGRQLSHKQAPYRLSSHVLHHEHQDGRGQKRSRAYGDVVMIDADEQPQKRPKKVGCGGRGGND
jgi:hypothetical protein